MIKQLVFAAIITTSMNAMDFKSRKKDLDNVPGIPKKDAIAYLTALEDMKETDPETGEEFEWIDVVDFEFFDEDHPEEASIITRYKHAIIALAYNHQIPKECLNEAQELVNKNTQTLYFVLTGNQNGHLEPTLWCGHWQSLKKTIKQRAIEADCKLIN